MRFTEMTRREFTTKDVIRNGEAPNYKWWWRQTPWRFKFFYILNLSIGMPYYKGDIINLLNCATKCSILYTYILICSAKTAIYSLFSPLLSGLVRQCHTWREAQLLCSTTAVEPRHCHDLTDHWRWRVFIPLPLPSNGSSSTSAHSVRSEQTCAHSLSSPLVTLSSQAFLCDFPINPWEKRLQNSIRQQIHWFLNSKSTCSRFSWWIVFVTLGACS
jgi:hypothetical protein